MSNKKLLVFPLLLVYDNCHFSFTGKWQLSVNAIE